MQDPTLVLISVCAISLICVALVAGLGFLVLRITGRTLTEFLGGGSVPDAVDTLAGVESTPGNNYVRGRNRTENLRAQAESLDFDAAVAKYRNNPNASTSSPVSSQAVQPLDDTSPRGGASRKKRNRRREDLHDVEEMEDMLGGFADEGGDDLSPF